MVLCIRLQYLKSTTPSKILEFLSGQCSAVSLLSLLDLVQEPTLRVLSVQLKYGPWRDAFVKCWARIAKGEEFRGLGEQGRARILVKALQSMCRQMHGCDDSVWNESLGKNISHVNGPLATLSRLGILKKVQQRRSRVRSVLKLGKMGTLRRLCSGVLEMASAKAKVLRWVKLASECHVDAPRTCQAWVAEHGKANAIFENHSLFADRSYMRNFVIRALLLAAMEAASVKKLSGSDGISAAAFAAAFPDQRSWISRMCTRPGITLADFLASIDYHGRPELLTMFLCLLLNPRMRLKPAWFTANHQKLCSTMVEQHRCLGVFRLPELCVQDALGH